MHYITRSRTAMTLAVLAAGLFVLAELLGLIAFATLDPLHIGTFNGLRHAHDWLAFSAALIAVVAVAAASWELVLAKLTSDAAEIGVAAAGTLLIAVGTLVSAISDSSQQTADIIGAIGVGVWGFLLVSRAARRSLAEHEAGAGTSRQASLWLTAGVGVLMLAVGSGLVVSPDNQGVSIAAGVITAIGFVILASAIALARNGGLLAGAVLAVVLSGLGLLAAAYVAVAITAGVVFTRSGTLTGLRVGTCIALFIEILGVLALGYAAWLRTADLVRAGSGTLWSPARPAGGSSLAEPGTVPHGPGSPPGPGSVPYGSGTSPMEPPPPPTAEA